MDRSEEDALIALVRDTARAEILPRFRRLEPGAVRAKTSAEDLVTDADLAAEAGIARGIARIMPGALMIGEEAASADPSILAGIAGADRAVILDPVDGTWNFANGLAVFGVILAVVEHGRTVWGLLYDPVMDDWVMARAGGGAWFGRPGETPERLAASPDSDPATANGYLPLPMFPATAREALAHASLKVGRAGQLRCSCHEYRLLAQGRTGYILTAALAPWDHAAGALIVHEAGGVARMIDGTPYAPAMTAGHMLVAANTGLHDALTGIFAPALSSSGP